LLGIALAILLFVAWLGHRLAKWKSLWARIATNPLLSHLREPQRERDLRWRWI